MPDGGVLWIATAIDFDDDAPQNDHVVLSVIDTPGWESLSEIRDRMFEPFVTTKGREGHRARARDRSLDREQHAGEINVLTKVGEGYDVRDLAGAAVRRGRGVGCRAGRRHDRRRVAG